MEATFNVKNPNGGELSDEEYGLFDEFQFDDRRFTEFPEKDIYMHGDFIIKMIEILCKGMEICPPSGYLTSEELRYISGEIKKYLSKTFEFLDNDDVLHNKLAATLYGILSSVLIIYAPDNESCTQPIIGFESLAAII